MKSQENILLDLERLRYKHSGIARVFINLTEGLRLLQITEQITLYGPTTIEHTGDYSHLKWTKFQKFNPFFARSFDLVHVSHQLSSYFHYKPKKQKKIVTLHDLNFLHEDFGSGRMRRNIRRVQQNVQNADVVVCISEFVKQDYLKNQHLFNIKKQQQIRVIYNGLQFPDGSKQYDLGKYNYLKNKRYFLNIGVLFPKKNQLSLLNVLSLIEEDLVFIVSGSKKEYEKELLKFIIDHQLETRVHILRNISDDEKYALIQNCEAMLHPSLAEGFGIPPIEAMYFGKPVFLSQLTSLPEIGGPDAFYFRTFDAAEMAGTIKNGMQTYRSDKNYAEKLRNWALQFDYREMASNYLALYREILKGK